MIKFFGWIETISVSLVFMNMNHTSEKWGLIFIAFQLATIQMMGGFDK